MRVETRAFNLAVARMSHMSLRVKSNVKLLPGNATESACRASILGDYAQLRYLPGIDIRILWDCSLDGRAPNIVSGPANGATELSGFMIAVAATCMSGMR